MKDRRERIGWQIVQWAATAAFALQVTAMGATLGSSSRSFGLAFTLVHSGYVLIRGLAAYGVWYGTRWGAWLGGVLATLTVPGYILFSLVRLETESGTVFEHTPLSLFLGWAQVAAGVAFLAGLLLIRRSHRSTAAGDA
jgi:hypothetical protein